ncbi:hypothetical protein [[Roseibacterium] beibuensis]|nr:hypothetical protein [Roseibacterium beibuensis]
MAAELSQATGREIRHIPISFEEFHANVAQAGGPVVADVFTAIARETLDGRNAHTTGGVMPALGCTPRDFANFAQAAARAADLGQGVNDRIDAQLFLVPRGDGRNGPVDFPGHFARGLACGAGQQGEIPRGRSAHRADHPLDGAHGGIVRRFPKASRAEKPTSWREDWLGWWDAVLSATRGSLHASQPRIRRGGDHGDFGARRFVSHARQDHTKKMI